MKDELFYVLIGEQQSGPYTFAHLTSLWNAGAVTTATLFWKEGQLEWEPLANMASLFLAPAPVDPQSPPLRSFTIATAAQPARRRIANAQPRTSGLAIAALILGILGVFTGITAIPAVICGHISLGRINKSEGSISGRREAIAGLIMGYIMIGILSIVVGAFSYIVLMAPVNVAGAQAMRVRADIEGISTELKLYEAINGLFPTTEQGLQALVTRPDTDPKPTQWRQLMEKVPMDPWQMPYQYETPGKHNPYSYDLYSAGPDRKPGTDDDIGNWDSVTK